MMDLKSDGTAQSREYASGHAHRRARVFWFWWMGMVFALPGAAQAAVLAATGQSPENGLVLAGLGLALSAGGWLVSLGPRFTRKAPVPAEDVARAEQYIRIVPGVAIAIVAVMLAIVVAMMLFAPKGMSPDVLPIMGFLAVFPVPIAAGMLYSRHVHRHRDRMYAKWLGRP
ncbi:hypothetical protein [Pseudarthrobacter sp. Y6]|uniref:hypothetical protein n=1 Tax=Pseudarthrobacter sp. Y6 TaxID=3418422 RepID=UPI003CF05A0A